MMKRAQYIVVIVFAVAMFALFFSFPAGASDVEYIDTVIGMSYNAWFDDVLPWIRLGFDTSSSDTSDYLGYISYVGVPDIIYITADSAYASQVYSLPMSETVDVNNFSDGLVYITISIRSDVTACIGYYDDGATAETDGISSCAPQYSIYSIDFGSNFILGASGLSYQNITSLDYSGKFIPEYAFRSCYYLQFVSIPNVTTISNYSFAYCDMLSDIDLSGVVNFGSNAFSNCSSLISVDLSLGASFGSYCFYNCSVLQTVEGFSHVDTVSSYCFSACYNLIDIDLSGAVTIGNYAFNGCRSLMYCYLPNVSSVGDYAFYGCVNLEWVYCGSDCSSVGARSFYSCVSCKLYYFASLGLSSVGNYAFYGVGANKGSDGGSGNSAVYIIFCSDVLPSLGGTSVFSGADSGLHIFIKSALYEDSLTATRWSSLTSYVYAIDDSFSPNLDFDTYYFNLTPDFDVLSTLTLSDDSVVDVYSADNIYFAKQRNMIFDSDSDSDSNSDPGSSVDLSNIENSLSDLTDGSSYSSDISSSQDNLDNSLSGLSGAADAIDVDLGISGSDVGVYIDDVASYFDDDVVGYFSDFWSTDFGAFLALIAVLGVGLAFVGYLIHGRSH